jgi:uncharacterized protein YggE
MQKVIAVLVFAVATGFWPTLHAQELSRITEISVTGRGETSLTPDRAVVIATVVTNASSATSAANDNARIVAEVLSKLRAAGYADRQVTNAGYSLGQDYENGDRRRPRGFVARNSVRVEVPRVNDVGRVIDAAIAAGATEVSPIQFSGPDMPGARRSALRSAVAEARLDAETLAEAAGGSLGKLLSISTTPAQPVYRDPGMVVVTGLASGGSTEIRPNDITVVAIASARWEFVPRR